MRTLILTLPVLLLGSPPPPGLTIPWLGPVGAGLGFGYDDPAGLLFTREKNHHFGCGFICKGFRQFDQHLHPVIEHLGRLAGRDQDGESPHMTYEEKVLPDGSIKKTNRTLLHQVDEEGRGFIIHTVHHVLHGPRDGDDGLHEDDDQSDESVQTDELPTIDVV